MIVEKYWRKFFGEHLTSVEVFKEYILPEIRDKLYNYVWVDLFCGEGNLILPMLEEVPSEKRKAFFEKHIYLFDIQKRMVEAAVRKAISYGIPEELARKKILVRDTIKNYPVFIFNKGLPVFHITNPPYFYKGALRKSFLKDDLEAYFKGENERYQDLYQIALANDLRYGVSRMIYIIPTNFLYGGRISDNIRADLFKHYTIEKVIFFETKVFDYTGTHVMLAFLKEKRKTIVLILFLKG